MSVGRIEFFKMLFKGVENFASFPIATERFFAKYTDEMVKAYREGNTSEWLDNVVEGDDAFEPAAKAFLRSDSFRKTLEEAAARKGLTDWLHESYEKALKGTRIPEGDVEKALKAHNIGDGTVMSSIAKRAEEDINAIAQEAKTGTLEVKESTRSSPFGNNNWYTSARSAQREASNPLVKAGFGLAANTLRASYASKEILMVGGAIFIGAHIVTEKSSSRIAADAVNKSLTKTADLMKDAWPETSKLLKKMGPAAAQLLIEIAQAPPDMAATILIQTAKYHNMEIPENQAKAVVHMSHGNLLGAGLALSGHEIDPIKMLQVYEDAQESGDPQAYIQKHLQEKFKLTDEQVAEYVAKGKAHKAEAVQLIEKTKDIAQEPAKAVEAVKAKFESAAENIDPTAKYGIVGGAMYSLSLMMFRAGPKTAAMVAEVCQTLIGSWADPLLGLVGIKPAFNAASGADALRASIHKSPKDLQDDPNVVGQNASVAQRTDLTLPLHAIPEPRT